MNPTMDRRTILRAALFSVPLAALGSRTIFAAEQTAPDTGSGPYTLPPLPYKFDALEPYIDKKTMELHHDKHHATYVKNLNDAIAKAPELNGKTPEQLITMLDEVPEAIRTTVRNNAGGHVNHTMFWALMTPVKARKVNTPTGALGDAIKSTFGSLENFQTAFNDAGAKRFGSGWVWLVRAKDGTLKVISTPNQDNPMMAEYEGATPIMGNDVWEHAYYLKYQNRRPEYLKAWWNTVNWDAVASRFAAK